MPTSLELRDFLRSRRSIRRFKPDPVPAPLVASLIESAACAPSAHNRQPWRFVVVQEAASRTRLADALSAAFEKDLRDDQLSEAEIQVRVARSQSRVLTAPLAIVLCVDMTEMDQYPDEKRRQAEYLMAAQSTANAGMQLLLAAHAEGLGGVWVCSPLFAPQTVQQALGLPIEWEPQAMYFLGYPIELPQPRDKKNIHEITKFI